MAFKKIENPQFTYLFYHREDQKDFNAFKREVSNLGSVMAEPKDIVVDLSKATTVNSSEIGFLVRLLKNLQGTQRNLRIVPSPQTRKMIESTNIQKLSQVVIYESQEAFVEQVKKMGG